jgi:hypothetical protein
MHNLHFITSITQKPKKTKQTNKQGKKKKNLELVFSPNPVLNYTCSIVENNGYWLLHGQAAME